MPQQKLKIFGAGPELEKLKKMAKSNIEFLDKVTDKEKACLLAHARAFIHPQVEDCGITPLESMASGRPVIAYPVGGVIETVIPGETGVFFKEQTWNSLFDVIMHFNYQNWDSTKIREHALKYDAAIFKNKIKKYIFDRFEELRRGLNQCTLDIR